MTLKKLNSASKLPDYTQQLFFPCFFDSITPQGHLHLFLSKPTSIADENISNFTIFLCYCLASLLYSFLQAPITPFLFMVLFFSSPEATFFHFSLFCTVLSFPPPPPQSEVRGNIHAKVLPMNSTNF